MPAPSVHYYAFVALCILEVLHIYWSHLVRKDIYWVNKTNLPSHTLKLDCENDLQGHCR